MTTPSPSSTEGVLQRERRLYSELRDRLINVFFNWLFDLRAERAQRRMRTLTILFLTVGVILTLIYHPFNVWTAALRDIFLYILRPDYAASFTTTDPFTNLINLVIKALIDPRILQYLPIFVAPFYIAQQLAAFYLADIFELEDITTARKFIAEVALTASDETIRISQGKISDKDRESPNYAIGGPGKVIVDFDSVALFERADGTPHVIGPSGKEPGGKATIDGFERFRLALDIRDHHVELRDQDSKSQSVKGRSRDGIPITATDVRLMFSINRGDNPQRSAEFPYPINPEAVERIAYKSASRVTPDQKEPSAYEFAWYNNMIGLIRGRLGGFMSDRNLTEYLASIGAPEVEKSQKREELIAEQVRRLTQPNDEEGSKSLKAPPNFTPRDQVSNLFSQFTEEFTKSARNNGVELHWIGVGTWKTPPEIDIVSEKHLEAWKLSQENMKSGNDGAMKKVENDATLQKMESLIKNVPIGAYNDIVDPYAHRKSHNKKQGKKHDRSRQKEWGDDEDLYVTEEEVMDFFKGPLMIDQLTKRFNDKIEEVAESMATKGPEQDSEHRGNMRQLLMDYRNQLGEAMQFMRAKGEPVPPSIIEAVNYINAQMGFRHWAGSSQQQ